MSIRNDYANHDALSLAGLIRSKQVSALEVTEEAIRRIEALNPQINAVVRTMFAEARAQASQPLSEGPFAGVPFLLKDLLATVKGIPTSAGNRWLNDVPATQDSVLVQRLRRAGLNFIGKTNTPEFGLMPTTEPELFGPTRNPWDLTRTAGGSSGGSGAAVAARMVPAASGGDGGGSIRVPAACGGIFGMKVTRGRTPTERGELWRGFANESVLTRSVRDSAALLDVLSGPASGAINASPPKARPFLDEVSTPPGRLRIAFTSQPFFGRHVHDDCKRALAQTAQLLQSLGHELVEAAPVIDAEACAQSFITILAAETRAEVEAAALLSGRKIHRSGYEDASYALGLLGKSLGASAYVNALNHLHAVARDVAVFFESHDVLLTPTLAEPPVLLGSLLPNKAERRLLGLVSALNAGWLLRASGAVEELAGKSFSFIPHLPLFNVTGQPAMSVPLQWTDTGLPLGMQFVGRFGDEATLFRLAGQLEQAQPWFDRAPPRVAI